MRNPMESHSVLVGMSLILCAASQAWGQGGGHAGQNMRDMKFAMFPGLPTCATGAVPRGDPAKGPSMILAKASAGCTIPWHWHTPNENIMMVSGTARVEMKDQKPVTLHAGGFALMPAKHVHRFLCTTACALYVYSDSAFDIHYVDAQGKEIPPEVALKAVKEKAAKEPK